MVTAIVCAVIAVIIAAYIFTVFPSLKYRKKNNMLTGGALYAHRGLFGGEVPENSMQGFALAKAHGYGMETDVHRTKDNVLVISHDSSLQRVCRSDKNIENMTYAEISDVCLPNGEKLPLFTDFLKLINGKVPIIIELKCEKNDLELPRLVAEALDGYRGEYCIESFNSFVVREYKRLRPDTFCGQLGGEVYSKNDTKKAHILKFMVKQMMGNYISRPHFAAYDIRHTGILGFNICRLLGIPTAAWTVRSQEQLDKIKDKYTSYIFEGFIPEQ